MILSAPARINLVDTIDLVELEIHELDLGRPHCKSRKKDVNLQAGNLGRNYTGENGDSISSSPYKSSRHF